MAFGGLSGIGYAATIWLPDCDDAGFEIGASSFMVYNWFTNPGYTLIERILGPIPDYIQVVLSMFYMYSCVTNTNLAISTELVFITKYLQAAVLPYVYIMSYLNGPRHDMFLAAFALLKQIFNILDATNYFNQEYNIIGGILALL